MARIELSNIGGGGTTLSLTTTGTSGASTLAGSVLNIPVYQGALSLSTSGTSGASTLVGNTLTIPTYQGQITLTTAGTSGASSLVGNTLNIPQYQGAISLTTTGTSGAATLVGNTLNVPQYATAPAGSAGQVQFNSTPSGSFSASAKLAWDDTAVQLNINAPSAPTARFNVRGTGATSTTINTRLTNSGNTELFRVNDAGSVGIGGLATGATLEINRGPNANPGLFLQNTSTTTSDFTGVGFNPAINTNTCALWSSASASGGGFQLASFTSSSYTGAASIILGHIGNSAPTTQEAVAIGGFKWNGGSGRTALSGNEIILSVSNGTASIAQFRGGGNVNIGSSFTPDARLHIRGSNTSGGTNALLIQNNRSPTPDDIYKIENNGKISYWATNTAAGTTGAQTIDKPSGTVNFAIGASALVVTNALCTTTSIVFATVRTNDATAYIKNVVPAGGSFTINLGAAATAETSVGFFIIN